MGIEMMKQFVILRAQFPRKMTWLLFKDRIARA
jgi:hypothetical protein